MAIAIFELFAGLEDLIREKFDDLPPGSVKAFIFGGCAVHLYTNARGSNDLDAELEASKSLNIESIILDLDTVYFDDPALGASSIEWDSNFNTGIPSLSPDYRAGAVPLVTGDNILQVYLVSAVDIAVSKLSRLAADDMNDIQSLYSNKRFTLDEFKSTAESGSNTQPLRGV